MAVVATLSKGYDLDYVWRQAGPAAQKSAVDYYIQASESGGEPPGRWWGPGAEALGFAQGQTVEREPYNLLFGERKGPVGVQLGRRPGGGQLAAHIFQQLIEAEPHATAERRRELQVEAASRARRITPTPQEAPMPSTSCTGAGRSSGPATPATKPSATAGSAADPPTTNTTTPATAPA
jgi:hypothetical protein